MTVEASKALDATGRHVLAGRGFSPVALSEFERKARTDERTAALAWLAGITSKRGVDWGARVRSCGTLFPARLPGGEIVILPMTCKCRGCPRCMVDRAARLSATIREAAKTRQALRPFAASHAARVAHRPARLVFVTLTQYKAHHRAEDAEASLDRFFASWKRLMNTKSRKRNARLRSLVAGGLRSLECVWSSQGKRNASGHRVRYSGWHTHGHCIFEIRCTPEEFAAELRRVWAWASPRSNPWRGVDVQTLRHDSRGYGELAKYITKPFALEPRRARELFLAAQARRFLVGFGEWRSWQSWVPEQESDYAGAVFSRRSLRHLIESDEKYDQAGRGAKAAPLVCFERFAYDEGRKKTGRVLDSTCTRDELWKGLERAAGGHNKSAEARADKREQRRLDRARR